MTNYPGNNLTIEVIRTRRVSRYFSSAKISQDILETIVEMGRWAPCSGNRRLSRFVVVTDKTVIDAIRIMSPGIDGIPAAMIVICIDWRMAGRQGITETHPSVHLDTGMAAENILLAAHALDVGAGPATSFSKSAVQELLDLPEWLSPELIVCMGYPKSGTRVKKVLPSKPIGWRDITYWNRFKDKGS